jgi:hypothetical protein
MNLETTTAVNAFHTLALLEEAVHFSQLVHYSFRPSLLLDNAFNLLTKGANILRIRRKVEERMSEEL